MKKKVIKFIVNSVLSVILTVLIVAAALCFFLPKDVVKTKSIISLYEKYDVYGVKTEAIWNDVEYTLFNSGVDEAFMKTCMPSAELVKALVDRSAESMFGGDPEEVSTAEYRAYVKKLFAEEAVRQGIEDEADVEELSEDYADDLDTIVKTLTQITGASTVHTYISLLGDYAVKALYVAAAALALVFIFMLVLNFKSTRYWITVPFASAFALLTALYAGYSNGAFFNITGHNAIQSAFFDLFSGYLLHALFLSAALLTVSALIAAVFCVISAIKKPRASSETEKA